MNHRGGPADPPTASGLHLLGACPIGQRVCRSSLTPAHFHALVVSRESESNVTEMVGRWKQIAGDEWQHSGHRNTLWQAGYFDRILREHDATEAVVRHIVVNPLLLYVCRYLPCSVASYSTSDSMRRFAAS